MRVEQAAVVYFMQYKYKQQSGGQSVIPRRFSDHLSL